MLPHVDSASLKMEPFSRHGLFKIVFPQQRTPHAGRYWFSPWSSGLPGLLWDDRTIRARFWLCTMVLWKIFNWSPFVLVQFKFIFLWGVNWLFQIHCSLYTPTLKYSCRTSLFHCNSLLCVLIAIIFVLYRLPDYNTNVLFPLHIHQPRFLI